MKAVAVLNRNGGTFRTTDIAAYCRLAESAFASRYEFECRPVAGKKIVDSLTEAADDSDIDIVIAGGGDGTISAAANAVWKAEKVLGVIPAGTMNLYARTLGIPLDIEAALPVLAEATIKSADIATANGRPFVHQFSAGFHSRMIRRRRLYGQTSRRAKIIASLRALADVIGNPPSFKVEIDADGNSFSPIVSALSVSNNRFGVGHLPYADEIDAGELGLYFAGPLPPMRYFRLSADLILGRWRNNADITEEVAKRVVFNFPTKPRRAKAVIDGELIALEDRVEIRTHERELRVLAPDLPAS